MEINKGHFTKNLVFSYCLWQYLQTADCMTTISRAILFSQITQQIRQVHEQYRERAGIEEESTTLLVFSNLLCSQGFTNCFGLSFRSFIYENIVFLLEGFPLKLFQCHTGTSEHLASFRFPFLSPEPLTWEAETSSAVPPMHYWARGLNHIRGGFL